MSTAPREFQQGAAMLSGDKQEQKSLFEAAAPWEQDEKNWIKTSAKKMAAVFYKKEPEISL